MAKVTFNAAIKQVSGKIGRWTYRGRGKGQSIVSATPEPPAKKRKISAAESETRLRTLRANAYSRSLTGNPELRARYVAVARARGAPLFAVSNRDFNNPPVIDDIDATAYRGEAGQPIRIHAHDDFEVREVAVKLCTRGGAVLESGAAQRQHDDTWQYVATATCSGTDSITVEVTAADWPKNKTTRSSRVDLAAPLVVDTSPRAQLVTRIRAHAQRRGRYLLPNGAPRVNFFDKYRLAHSPGLLRAIAEQLVPHIPRATDLLAGLELGGVPVATILSQLTGRPLVLLRKQPRDWGTTAPAEGAELAGRRVLPIADVVTTGAQLATSIRALRAFGATVTHALCVIDQQAGAPNLLEKNSVLLTSLFTAFELIA